MRDDQKVAFSVANAINRVSHAPSLYCIRARVSLLVRACADDRTYVYIYIRTYIPRIDPDLYCLALMRSATSIHNIGTAHCAQRQDWDHKAHDAPSAILVKCWTLGGERERVRVYIRIRIIIHVHTRSSCASAEAHRAASNPFSFPVPLVSKTAPSVSLLWRFSSTSLPFLLSTSFQSRLTVPFLLCH